MTFALAPLLFSALFASGGAASGAAASGGAASGAAPAPATTAAAQHLASTYDQATCATVRAGDDTDDTDGWALAAIGEDAPPAPIACAVSVPALPTQLAADCNDPHVSRLAIWMTSDMIGTCYMARSTGNRPGLRAARPDSRRIARPLVEVNASDTPRPLAPTTPDHELGPVLLSTTPTLALPPVTGLLQSASSPSLRSISGDQLLRPPRVS